MDRRNSAYFADKSCRQILVKFFECRDVLLAIFVLTGSRSGASNLLSEFYYFVLWPVVRFFCI